MQWIDVKKELPQKQHRGYLVFIKFAPPNKEPFSGVMEATFYHDEEDKPQWFCGLCNLSWEMPCEVTHWMSLPAKP